MPFVTITVQDSFVQDGKKGGSSAAGHLLEAVGDHIQEVEPEASPNVQYKIRVYANVNGLARAYRDANIVDGDCDLEPFIQGFNMESPLCDFVDAGPGKDTADEKIRGELKLCLRVFWRLGTL